MATYDNRAYGVLGAMRIALLSREYPPEVYGGAGVHVQHLAASLSSLVDVEVHCFGAERPSDPRLKTFAYRPWDKIEDGAGGLGPLGVMSADLAMASALGRVDIVHSHTWYTNLAGHLTKLLYGVPHILTVHSLEPKRPWKAEQLGRGYLVSSWCERVGVESADAVIAVSHAAARDICDCYPAVDSSRIDVIHNGVDPAEFRPDPSVEVLEHYGIDPCRPIVLCVGRITHQKGIGHLVAAADEIEPRAQIVLRVGEADTPALALEIGRRIADLKARREGVVWIDKTVDRRSLVGLLSAATVACYPSIYEPFGLVNLEAMACETAVVASAVGGVPEVIENGFTGVLVSFEPKSATDPDPADPRKFAHDLAAAVNDLIGNPNLAQKMGQSGRRRVIEEFSWSAVAAKTVSLYSKWAR